MNSSANVSNLEECSMGTQTETIPKMTYKELKKQPILVRIIAQLEIYNSDGGECEYRKIELETKTAVPEKYKNTPLGQIENINEYQWANHLQVWVIARRKRERAIIECGLGPVNGVEPYHYRYTIMSVKIVKNKKYKEVAVEKANEIEEPRKTPRQRRPKSIAEIPEPKKVAPDTELRIKMEEIQGQMAEIQRQIAEAEQSYINAHLQYFEAEKALEKTLRLKGKALQQEDKIRTELEKVKIEIASNTNKNGYVILAHDDCGGKEHIYGHAQKFEDALAIAKEAVKTGKRRQNQNVECKTDCIVGEKVEALYTQNGRWYDATISKVNKIWRKGEQITQIDVTWDDGINAYSRELNETQIKKIAKYNRFDSARIVDLDTQEDVEEFGQYVYVDGAW